MPQVFVNTQELVHIGPKWWANTDSFIHKVKNIIWWLSLGLEPCPPSFLFATEDESTTGLPAATAATAATKDDNESQRRLWCLHGPVEIKYQFSCAKLAPIANPSEAKYDPNVGQTLSTFLTNGPLRCYDVCPGTHRSKVKIFLGAAKTSIVSISCRSAEGYNLPGGWRMSLRLFSPKSGLVQARQQSACCEKCQQIIL